MGKISSLANLSSHDWGIAKAESILKKQGWKTLQVSWGQRSGPDLLMQAPSGETVLIESEIEHASGTNFACAKANLIQGLKIQYPTLHRVLILGEERHARKWEAALKEMSCEVEVLNCPVPKLCEGLLPL